MNIALCSLYSGSTGNSTLVTTAAGSLLIDAGGTMKKLSASLDMIHASLQETQGILITHEHVDHISALGPVCRKYGVDLISLIAPTSADRIAMIAKEAEGFIYIVSSLGVTGVRSEITTDISKLVSVIRENTDIPCAVGFGISTPEQAARMSQHADGVIVGSAIVRQIAELGKDSPAPVGEYVAKMKSAIS